MIAPLNKTTTEHTLYHIFYDLLFEIGFREGIITLGSQYLIFECHNTRVLFTDNTIFIYRCHVSKVAALCGWHYDSEIDMNDPNMKQKLIKYTH